MGFCLLNNVAIAARALQREHGLERVMIFDWDVHHGNGTQHSFESDPSVLYASTHQFPFYPGTGDFDEAGVGAGAGSTLNLPLPAGCGDAEYVGVVQRVLVPVARAWKPQLIMVSCGFDAHRDDPLASMQVSGSGFAALTALVRALADDVCGGRLVFALEGGYALTGLREGTDAVLDGLLAPQRPRRRRSCRAKRAACWGTWWHAPPRCTARATRASARPRPDAAPRSGTAHAHHGILWLAQRVTPRSCGGDALAISIGQARKNSQKRSCTGGCSGIKNQSNGEWMVFSGMDAFRR